MSDADAAGVELISRRVKERFYGNQPKNTADVILQHSFPLQASETRGSQSDSTAVGTDEAEKKS